MTRTWHGSCYVCTCTTSDHQFQIARGVSPSFPRLSKGGRRTLLASAATTFDDQKTMHRGHGACRFRVMGLTRRDASFPAHQQGRVPPVAVGSVRFLLPLTLTRNLAEAFKSLGPFSNDGCGALSSAPATICNLRTQPRWQAIRCMHPSHLQNLRFNAFEPSDGARGSVPDRTGKLPPERGERPHVGND